MPEQPTTSPDIPPTQAHLGEAARFDAVLFDGVLFDAVLFDLDGTLIDSTASVERIWRRWAAEWGLPEFAAFPHGVPARQVLATLVRPDEIDAAFAHVSRLELAETVDVTLLPGARSALEGLPPHRTAIVTSGVAAVARLRMRQAGLAAPPVVVTADDVRTGKPHPAPYLAAARLLGVDPARCLVVEDAPAGLAAGRAAGCTTLALTTTHRAAELVADAVLPDLSAVRFVDTPDGVRLHLRT